MANYQEQMAQLWDEWESLTGASANDPNDFLDWAVAEGRLVPRPEDVRKIFRRQLTESLRQVMRRDEAGTTYRAKQCVSIIEHGKQLTLWFDVDRGGTPQLRQKAVRQRRDSIVNDVYKAYCDVEHINFAYPQDAPIQFELDFTEDTAERKALELLEHQKKNGTSG